MIFTENSKTAPKTPKSSFAFGEVLVQNWWWVEQAGEYQEQLFACFVLRRLLFFVSFLWPTDGSRCHERPLFLLDSVGFLSLPNYYSRVTVQWVWANHLLWTCGVSRTEGLAAMNPLLLGRCGKHSGRNWILKLFWHFVLQELYLQCPFAGELTRVVWRQRTDTWS